MMAQALAAAMNPLTNQMEALRVDFSSQGARLDVVSCMQTDMANQQGDPVCRVRNENDTGDGSSSPRQRQRTETGSVDIHHVLEDGDDEGDGAFADRFGGNFGV